MAARGVTGSVCPVCLRRIPAERVRVGGEVHLRKACPEHGPFQAVIWRGHLDFETWAGEASAPPEDSACPTACGLCPDHASGTCCVVLEVTARCNLACTFCLAGEAREAEPTLEALQAALRRLSVPGTTLVQLSGGEPTVRNDLPELIAAAKAAGCRYVQLNTNGLRLGTEPGYARRLAEAGLSFVFMQFDGLDDGIHQRLRGRALASVKRAAIDACAAANLGVTLVPTLVRDVNTHKIGDLLRFAVSQAPAVRGVHFQPVSFFGRTPCLPEDPDRFTLDELVAAVVAQSEGLIRTEHLLPSRCDHPLCGFHGDFMVAPGGGLKALSRPTQTAPRTCCAAERGVPARVGAFRDSAGEEGPNPEDLRSLGGWITSPSSLFETSSKRRMNRDEGDERDNCKQALPAMPLRAQEAECEDRLGSGSPRSKQQAADKNRAFVARRWERPEPSTSCCGGLEDLRDMGFFLERVKTHGFTVTAMAFQDAGNLDLARLRRCSLHVYREGRFVPFCASYLTPLAPR